MRTGLALCDPLQSIASPLRVLAGLKRPALLLELVRVVDEEEVAGVLVGMPVGLDGQEGPMAARSRALAGELAGRLGVPVAVLDERHTSQAADRAFIEAGVRASDRRGRVDMVAAALLLQAFLDGRRG